MIKKAKDNDFPSAAPNPLRVALSSKGNAGVHWKKALTRFISDEKLNVRCKGTKFN